MKRLTWVLLFSLCSCVLRAETTIDTRSVKRMVVFIYPEKDARPDEQRPSGTGFLIVVPRLGEKISLTEPTLLVGQVWLITARHIVDPAWAGCSGEKPTAIYMRVNKKNYEPTTEGGRRSSSLPLLPGASDLCILNVATRKSSVISGLY